MSSAERPSSCLDLNVEASYAFEIPVKNNFPSKEMLVRVRFRETLFKSIMVYNSRINS